MSQAGSGWKILGVLASGALAFFALADVPEQARKWQRGIELTWTVVGPFMTAEAARWMFLFAAVAVFWWTWRPRRAREEPARSFTLPPDRPSSIHVEVDEQTSPAAPQKFFTPRTPKELFDLALAETLEVKRQAALAPHIDKWLHVEGKVTDVSYDHQNFPTVDVDLGLGSDFRRGMVRLTFPKELTDVILALDKDDIIRANGRISTISKVWIFLKDCELLGYDARSQGAGSDPALTG